MIADALKFLRDMADQAATPKLLDGGTRKQYYAMNGDVANYEKEIKPRQHVVSDLGDLISLANRFREDGAIDGNGNAVAPVVWYNEGKVILVIDDNGHRLETATLDLTLSDTFARAIVLRRSPEWLPQKEFIRLLRIDLAGTLNPGALLDKVRRVKFENGVTTTGEIKRERESLGRDILAKVEVVDLPEIVPLHLPVYKTSGEREPYVLQCAVEVDPSRCMFQLLPLPDEIERVQQCAVDSIRERLAEGLNKDIPHYYGKP